MNMKKHLLSPFGSLLFLVVILSACHKPKDLVFKEYKNLKMDKASFTNTTLSTDLVFYNPNNFSLQVNRTDLDIFVDSTFLGHSSQNVQVTVPKKADFVLPLKLDLDMKNLLKNGMTGLTSLFNRDVKVRFLGSIKLGKLGVYKSFKVDYTTVQNLSLFK
jgi:LEA14-like dessication related protein